MVEYEADDALAAAAVRAAADPRVERVIICTPDKDLAQSVRGTRIVQLNRRTNVDSRRGRRRGEVRRAARRRSPTISRWSATRRTAIRGCRDGARNRRRRCWRAISISRRFPRTRGTGASTPPTPATLAATFARERDRAFLFRDLATLRTDIPVFDDVEELRWGGPTAAFAPLAAQDGSRAPVGTRPPRSDDDRARQRGYFQQHSGWFEGQCVYRRARRSGEKQCFRSPELLALL